MIVSKEEAGTALREIGATRDRVITLQVYRNAGPFFMVWGLVWVIANSLTDLVPTSRSLAWSIAASIGGILSMVIAWRQGRARRICPASERWSELFSRRFGLSFLVVIGFFVSIAAVLGPTTGRETNAFISLFWAFAYTLAGVWAGWRMALIGVVLAGLILFGYFALHSHYYLWMGLIVGGTLFFSGLWLRQNVSHG